jgi:phosphomannomutase
MSARVISTLKEEYSAASANSYALDIDGISVFYPRVPEYPTVDDVFQIDMDGDPEGKTYREVQNYTPEWWFNVRASNNEPLLRINFESRSAGDVAGRTAALIDRIRGICGSEARISVQDWGSLTPGR